MNPICDRLREAATLGGEHDIELSLDSLGVVVRRRWVLRTWTRRVDYLDIAEARYNVLRQAVEEAIQIGESV